MRFQNRFDYNCRSTSKLTKHQLLSSQNTSIVTALTLDDVTTLGPSNYFDDGLLSTRDPEDGIC
jgi:hypothetical protein